jgi:hypothetical protein
MQQLIIQITDKSKARYLINFLRQLDFVKVDVVDSDEQVREFQNGITESFNDLKAKRVSTWKNKKVMLKHA